MKKRKPCNRSIESKKQCAEYKAKLRKAWRQEVLELLGGKCINCNSVENLHVDHINQNEKLFCISKAPSKKALMEEIKKCQILCSTCHRLKSNREISGENCHAAKLTHEDVKKIIIRSASGISGRSLSKEFNVNPMQISRIINGKRWRYMTDET